MLVVTFGTLYNQEEFTQIDIGHIILMVVQWLGVGLVIASSTKYSLY